ncbi:hypothetical protein KKB69_00130, partial [Patescibacteria group bacterium]|nr:hypothetical protein [Patescibacteria group bacterium]
TDNVDINLGYEVWRSLAGSELEYLGRNLTGVSVDTASSTKCYISYVATDQAGNTATTTRMIIISSPSTSDVDGLPPTEPVATSTPL